MPRPKNRARLFVAPGAAPTTKRQAAAMGASKKRPRSFIEETQPGGRQGGRGGFNKRQKIDESFLTEEENLATYYPLPHELKPPPSEEFLKQLHDEIYSYSQSHVPTPAMTSARWAIIHGVRDAARELFGPEVETVPFGSFVTGLYIGSSDIDLVLLNGHFNKSQIPPALLKLGQRLRKLGLAKDLSLIPGARVPLLKYTSVGSDIPVDISISAPDGVLSANLMKKQVDVFPAFKPLTLFLKAFMQAMGLADVFTGGVSSYILQVMILFHLQVQESLHPPSRSEPPSSASSAFGPSSSFTSSTLPTQNLGYLLYTFFELFGCTFEYETHGFRIWDLKGSKESQLEVYTKAAAYRTVAGKPWLLSMEDPIQKERDIGGACFGIRRVQRCFALARQFLCSEPVAPPSAAAKSAATTPSKGAAAAAKEHQEASNVHSEQIPSYVIDTVGDATHAASATIPAAAASSVPSAASTPAAAAAAAAASSSSPVDSHATTFSSSFGFLLSSLLTLPVRYSLSELRRASESQPAWRGIVEKLEKLDGKKEKKERKQERAKKKARKEEKARAKAEKAERQRAKQQSKSDKKKAEKAKEKAATKSAAGGQASAVDVAASMLASSTGSPASSARAGMDATTTGGEESESSDEEDGEHGDEGEDDSDVEIIDQDGSRVKPIPIDDMDEDEVMDFTETRPPQQVEGEEQEEEKGEEVEGDAEMDESMEAEEEEDGSAAKAAEISAAAAENLAVAGGGSSSSQSVPLDGDAMLAEDHHDENTQLNLRE